MKLRELPEREHECMVAMLNSIKGKIVADNAWGFRAYNGNGTRFFSAVRRCIGWQDTNNGNNMPFGGGNYWEIRYGCVGWERSTRLNPVGEHEVTVGWCDDKTFSKITSNDQQEIIIPQRVSTKQEMLEVYNKIVSHGDRNFPPIIPENMDLSAKQLSAVFCYE